MMYIELPIKMYMYNKNGSNTRVAFNCFVFFNKFKEIKCKCMHMSTDSCILYVHQRESLTKIHVTIALIDCFVIVIVLPTTDHHTPPTHSSNVDMLKGYA